MKEGWAGADPFRLQGPFVDGPLLGLLVIGRPGSVRSSLLAQSADPVASSPPARQYDGYHVSGTYRRHTPGFDRVLAARREGGMS